MRKSKAARIAGFTVALGATASLVGFAANGTGAYFTDSHDGSISASSGHLKLNSTDENLSFSDLMPGQDKTQKISYNTDSSGNEDIWMYFPSGAAYDAFTGYKDTANGLNGGLGRYGHFQVANNGSVDFRSYNLQNLAPGGSDTTCPVDANGDGGSDQQASSPSDTPPLCGVPQYIKLASNVASGTAGEIEVTFGLTGKAQGQNVPWANVPFHIVATQNGVRPDAANF